MKSKNFRVQTFLKNKRIGDHSYPNLSNGVIGFHLSEVQINVTLQSPSDFDVLRKFLDEAELCFKHTYEELGAKLNKPDFVPEVGERYRIK